jgi:hypothetical protein
MEWTRSRLGVKGSQVQILSARQKSLQVSGMLSTLAGIHPLRIVPTSVPTPSKTQVRSTTMTTTTTRVEAGTTHPMPPKPS